MATEDGAAPADAPVGRSSADQREIDVEEHATALEERQAGLDERELVVTAREALADERELAADRRETLADERERLADDRDLMADRREAMADQREQALNDLEARIDARAGALGVPTETVNERVLETIARGRVLLSASQQSLDRSEAAIHRARARRRRDRATVDREAPEDVREPAPGPNRGTEPERTLVPQVDLLRRNFRTLAHHLAGTEEEIARFHERRAEAQPEAAARHTAIADKARRTAQRVREAADKVTPVEAGIPSTEATDGERPAPGSAHGSPS